ncbi:MAG: serine hydrolase [Proteobacteria bacterium]|nr:serine hydrolase [Pseudomonadota bacterium]
MGRTRNAITAAVALALAWQADNAVAEKRDQPARATRLPQVLAPRAVVMDVATGTELFAKNSQEIGGIASTGKIFVAMVVRRRGIVLDGVTEITKVDRDYARGGARTRLHVRHSFKNIDLLRAMLIASDNRAPTALGRAVGLDPAGLIAAMNDLAAQLGLPNTRFTDPSGLRGNVSTAREMAIAFKTALHDPVLLEIMKTRRVTLRSIHSRPRRITYRNTNKALHRTQYRVEGGKTGFTKMAGYCLVIAAHIAGRDIIMVFLGERKKSARYTDFHRLARWLTESGIPQSDNLPTITGKSSVIPAAATGMGSL